MRYALLVYVICMSLGAIAQETKIVKEKSMVTGQDVEWKITGVDKVIVRDSSSHYIQIYVRETDGVLYGNKCAEEITKKKGVEFIIIPKNVGYGMSKRSFFFTNLKHSFKLFFKNGPFWKKRIKKDIRRCREGTRDRMG